MSGCRKRILLDMVSSETEEIEGMDILGITGVAAIAVIFCAAK